MRLLLVEDDLVQVNSLKPVLSKAGYAVEVAMDGLDGAFRIREEEFDAIVLDLGLPKRSGLDLLQDMREAKNDTPVLVLTARDTWQERVDGLKAGADDYLGKPYHVEELIARLEALIRRKYGQSSPELQHAGVRLNQDSQSALDSSENQHDLTGVEFKLLRYLMLNPGKVISKTQLSEHVYEEEQLRDSNVIEVYINRLRQRFGKEFIKTLRGQGYRLKD
ncbi:response regulator transcription factor [uncultured Neptuniibacter sp.]|uniref:response regulator transcription factor n=1 Tax=uncultured Neptuniibacter sp. TaxID=502143 RepID=UPI00260D68B3|nr:response regulator transcription factor [uncultured Neptuniibacter sp.]